MNVIRRGGVALFALALVAGACGDDGGGGTKAATGATAATASGTSAASGTGGTGATAATGAKGIFATDARGGVYSAFQSTFDRSKDPFSSLTEFCTAAPSTATRKATDAASADSITVVHLRTKLEQLQQIGFAIPVGNVPDMFETFTRYINEKCGGINGRKIKLELVEVNSQSTTLDADRRAACIAATEDLKTPIVINSTGLQGTAIPCISIEHDALLFTSTSGEESWTKDSKGRIKSNAPTLDEFVRNLSSELIRQGVLKDKKIAVIVADTPGQKEALDKGLIATLDKAGIKVVQYDTIGCKGGSVCTEGTPASVDKLISNGINVLFAPGLNVVSLPQYVKEMATKGIKVGQIQIYNSNFNSGAGDLVASKIPEFGGDDAGKLYNGTISIDPAPTGILRVGTYQKPAFNAMCEKTYNENNKTGEKWDYATEETNSRAGMVATVCGFVRMAARTIYLAGDNPTRADLLKAAENLGPVDTSNQEPSTFKPGKPSGFDTQFQLKYVYPCPAVGSGFKGCYVPASNMPTVIPR